MSGIITPHTDESLVVILTQSVSWGQHPFVESSMGGGVGVMGSNSPTETTLTFIVFIFSSSNTGIKI